MLKQLLIVTFCLGSLLAWGAPAQSVPASAYIHDEDFPFIIITKDDVKELPEMDDKEFYTTSLNIIFQVNKTNIRRDDPFLAIYRNEILPRINNEHLQLRKIFVRGAASPEGDYENNRRLGQGRTQALLNELQRDLEHQYIKPEISTTSVTEDYGRLCLLMEEAGDPDYEVVKNIYDECKGDEKQCKAKLKKVQGGRLWARMLKQYFPTLRSASLVIWFSEPDLDHAPMKDLVAQPIQPVVADASIVGLPDGQLQLLPVLEQASARRHLIAVRTNLVHDLLYMPRIGWTPSPNIQFEYYPLDGHLTYNLGMTWGTHRHWDSQEFFQMRDFQAEVRRYFKGGGEFMGLYMGAFAEFNVYGIGFNKEDGWEGEGAGVGLTLGYVLPLTKKKNFRLEFMLGAGFYGTLFDPYVYGNPVTGREDGKYYYNYLGTASSFKKRNHITTWLGPLNVGVQLTYDIIYRKRHHTQKGGHL